MQNIYENHIYIFFIDNKYKKMISDCESHGGHYEDYSLLGCDIM
jgi:hypothetical protein